MVYKTPAPPAAGVVNYIVHTTGNQRQTITAALESKICALQQISHVMLKYTFKKRLKEKSQKTTTCVFLVLWEPDSQSLTDPQKYISRA